MQLTKVLSLILATALLVTGCGASSTSSSQINSDTSNIEATTITFTDSLGREVNLPSEITSIVPSGPLAQMVLFSIAPEKFSAIASKWGEDTAQYFGEEYYKLPLVGQVLGGKDGNLEELAKIDPQVIIDIGEPKGTLGEDMDKLTAQTGINVIHITANTQNMAEVYNTLGALLGKETEAQRLAAYCDEIYNNTLTLMDTVGVNKRGAIYCLGDDGLSVIGKGSYHAEVLDILFDNRAVIDNPSGKGTGNQVDMEQMLLWNPEIIFFAPGSIYDSVATNPAWNTLDAIKNKNYHLVPQGPYNWLGFPPSVNRYIGMIWLSETLYPKDSQYDIFTEAQRYYKLFYHCDLTEEQFNNIIGK